MPAWLAPVKAPRNLAAAARSAARLAASGTPCAADEGFFAREEGFFLQSRHCRFLGGVFLGNKPNGQNDLSV